MYEKKKIHVEVWGRSITQMEENIDNISKGNYDDVVPLILNELPICKHLGYDEDHPERACEQCPLDDFSDHSCSFEIAAATTLAYHIENFGPSDRSVKLFVDLCNLAIERMKDERDKARWGFRKRPRLVKEASND